MPIPRPVVTDLESLEVLFGQTPRPQGGGGGFAETLPLAVSHGAGGTLAWLCDCDYWIVGITWISGSTQIKISLTNPPPNIQTGVTDRTGILDHSTNTPGQMGFCFRFQLGGTYYFNSSGACNYILHRVLA